MIKATDLRLGNLLLYKGEVVYVTTLTLDVDDEREESIGFCKAGQATDEIIGWDRNLDLQGIAITPEWLERCAIGFFEADTATESLINLIYKGAVIATFKRDSLPPCKFVHQLQNLIQSLTGTELEIKLP